MTRQTPDHSQNNAAILGECIVDHYVEYLGEPSVGISYEQDTNSPSIQTLVFENVFGGCQAFCTLGLSKYQIILGDLAELCLIVDEFSDTTTEIFAAMSFYLIQKGISLQPGIAIEFDKWGGFYEDFSRTFGKPALYITVMPSNMPTRFGNISCNNDLVELYFCFFLADSEYAFINEKGADAFEELLVKNDVDVLHLRRTPIV